MNVLLLGNGFDIYHKLPTKYRDFLQTVDFLLEESFDDAKTIGDVFGNSELHNRNAYIKECYDRHKNTYDKIELDKDKVKQLVELARGNMWFTYLRSSFNADIGWIDFEREISYVLLNLKDFLDDIVRVFMMNEEEYSRENLYIVRNFNFFFVETEKVSRRKICEVKKEYLLEYPLGSGNIIVDKTKIINYLFDDLKKLATCLRFYLECFVDRSLDCIKEEKDFVRCEAICSIDKTLSFNYTNAAEKLYFHNNTLHLHGNVNDNIILGINPDETDELEEIDTAYIAFKKYYQRACIGTDDEYLRWMKEITESRKTVKLLIMGHSLDVTDKDVVIELFNCAQEIIILFHNEQAKYAYIENLIKIFGKREFDSIRKDKNLTFMPLDMDFTEFKKKRSDEAYKKLAHQMHCEEQNYTAEEIVIV